MPTLPVLLFCAVAVAALDPARAQAEIEFDIHEVEGPYGFDTVATDLGPTGDVVGFANSAANGYAHAFVWRDGTAIDLGTVGGTASQARAVNRSGQVVGEFRQSITPPVWRAFLYADGTTREIAGLDGTSAWAWDINDRGDIVGEMGEYRGARRGFVLAGGKLTRIGTLGGGSSAVYALNSQGDFTGSATLAGDVATHGFMVVGGVSKVIPPLGGTGCFPKDINERGEVVGDSTLRPDDPVTGGFVVRLGVLTPLALSTASALNDRSHIVGATDTGAALVRDDRVLDLHTLIPANTGWHLQLASAINNADLVVGFGTRGDTRMRVFLLTPRVPLPPVAPTLRFERQGDRLVLRWSPGETLFRIETCEAVSSDAFAWTAVPTPPEPIDTDLRVTIPIDRTASYFRLVAVH